MATTIFPSQTRTIDAYSEYNSNIVSRLTDMVTRGIDSLHSPHAVDVEIDTTAAVDSTSPIIIVKTGYLFKDGIIISVDSDFSVDMEDIDFYIGGPGGGGFDTTGYYWIMANYRYYKAKPAPQLSIGIFRPDQHSLFTNHYLFLKAVLVTYNGEYYQIESVHDFDPNEPNVGKRVYTQIYPGLENSIPTNYDVDIDEGRLIYVKDKAALYFGFEDQFLPIDTVRDNIDTTNCEIGDVAYVASDGKAYPAIADSTATVGNAVVLNKGLKSDGTGRVKLVGRVDNVPVETGQTVNIGDLVFLSAVEGGRVLTGSPASPNEPQLIGRSLTTTIGPNRISLWLMPTLISGSINGLRGPVGPQGPIGPTGASGASGASGTPGAAQYPFTQSAGASIWTITHNLGKRPVLINVYDAGYNQIIPHNIYCNSTNQCTISFLSLVSGFALVG